MIRALNIFGLLCFGFVLIPGNEANQAARGSSLLHILAAGGELSNDSERHVAKRNVDECDRDMYCVPRKNCIDGIIEASHFVFPDKTCPSPKICCSIRRIARTEVIEMFQFENKIYFYIGIIHLECLITFSPKQHKLPLQ